MNCNEITERLDAWMDGELAGAEADAVEHHLADCGACATAVAEREALVSMLQSTLTQPAEDAAAEGRFDGLWSAIETRLPDLEAQTEAAAAPEVAPAASPLLQPQPTPGPSLWKRIATWWSERFDQRQAWVPALAAAAVLVIMVALIADRNNVDETAAPGVAGVAEAPTTELPPFAQPRVVAKTEKEPDQGVNGDRPRLADGTPAPRRRGAEEMVARNNEAFVVSYEVDRGIVLIEQPEEAEQPMVVWHLMPEDVDDSGGDEGSI